METTGGVQVRAGEVGERGLRGLAGEVGTTGSSVPSVWEGERDRAPPHV